MQEISTAKSLFYGVVIMLIFLFSSCEFVLISSQQHSAINQHTVPID